MNDPDFQKAYEEQNRRDQIAYSNLATALSIILNLLCSVMDYFMYPDKMWLFFKVRLGSIGLVAAVWLWFHGTGGRKHYRIFGVVWYASPLAIILWMIYAANDPLSPYYAGLNIVLLAVGLLSPWTHKQNLVSALLVLVLYVFVATAMQTPQPLSSIINNTTFLVLTAVIVVAGSVANARQRYREFELRWELDKNRRIVEESNQKLRELDQVKSRFFANISHELRTPLTLLLAPLDSLIRTNEHDQTRMLLTTMRANGMRLLKLINDLLDLVRLESGKMEIKCEPVDVADFVKGLVSSANQLAQDKNLRLERTVDPAVGIVMADRDKLEKVVLNLVFNALKFTPAGGRVEVRAERRSGNLILAVSDTGMGISAKNLPYIFDRFWQADDSSKRKYQGAGIGLALVKELVEIQGGTVSVESQETKGTTFTISLPFEPVDPGTLTAADRADSTSETGSTAPSQEWISNLYRRAEFFPVLSTTLHFPKNSAKRSTDERPSILVADDEPDMLQFLSSQLRPHYQVIEVMNGVEAVENAQQFLPDIILLDMMMPEKDGLQACREIRERTSTQSIPVVLLTARADEETKLAALSAGASDFLTKPFSTTELHVRIKNLVESYKYQIKVSKQKQALESTIDQLKETETQLVQSEKLASLGRMSAGIIHEINNPLNFATTGLFTLHKKSKFVAPEQQEEYQEILRDVEDGIKRVKNIVSDLRMFTHPDTESREQVEVADVVAASLRFLSNEWKGKIQVEQNLVEHQTIWANKNKLIHVLVNLLQNSLDALRRKTFEDERPMIWLEGREVQGKSLLIVRDNGTGIDAQHLDKIFDPFFTTKDVGEGMGLGLAICYRIVQECQGRISVRTEPGKYSEFTLEFPLKA